MKANAIIVTLIILTFIPLGYADDKEGRAPHIKFKQGRVGETTIVMIPMTERDRETREIIKEYAITVQVKIIKILYNGYLIDLVEVLNHKEDTDIIKESFPFLVPWEKVHNAKPTIESAPKREAAENTLNEISTVENERNVPKITLPFSPADLMRMKDSRFKKRYYLEKDENGDITVKNKPPY